MINNATWDLITRWEGLVLVAEPDPVGIPTVGWGHTSVAGPPKVYNGLTITEAQAIEILQRDLAAVECQVAALLRVPVNMNQWGALVSFTFNLGPQNLARSTLLRRLNASDYDVENEFGKWVYADGHVLKGLVNRRAEEAKLWDTPDAQ